jgi:maleate isomerase
MKKIRVGMIVPSLNTIAEDDFRAFCPPEVAYHVHRIRLRKENGRVTMQALTRAYLEATEEATYLKDLSPNAIAFNCTGASVAYGATGDVALASQMSEQLGLPCTNTMVAIKEALRAVKADKVLHVCPFTDEFSRIERDSLIASGVDVARTISLDFTDAKVAAQMEPKQMIDFVLSKIDDTTRSVLLSCANVRAIDAVEELEASLGLPVVTSNQAMLWHLLRIAGWNGSVAGAGQLFRVDTQTLPRRAHG